MKTKIEAVLFDMDGVLADSEPFICKAAVAMFAEHGLEVKEEDFLPFVGAGENAYLGGVAAKYSFPIDIERDKKRTYELYLQVIQGELKALPGVESCIRACKRQGWKIAVATSADEVKMTANLAEIGLPLAIFDATVNGLEVERKKPQPDIYLKAASLLGVDPSRCIVIEDAVNGIEAAKAAGAYCVALTTSFEEELLKEADLIIRDLSCFDEVLRALGERE